MSEARYYRNIGVWLEKNGYYIGRSEPKVYKKHELFIRKGRKKAQVDVAGVKNAGKDYFDDIEIAIVEVKHANVPRPLQLKEIGQAASYQNYAHYSYLAATDRIAIGKHIENDAEYRGIGLLRIPFDFYKKRPQQVRISDIEIIRNPKKTIPNEAEMLDFLGTLDILRCSLCGCYFNSWGEYEEEFPQLPPKNASFKRLERNRVFDVFPDLTDDQFNTRHRQIRRKMWKHLCLLCLEDLVKVAGVDKISKDIDALKKEVTKLKHKEEIV